jgi:hypothetical protein
MYIQPKLGDKFTHENKRRRKGRLVLEDRSQESRFAKTSMIDDCIMRMKCKR